MYISVVVPILLCVLESVRSQQLVAVSDCQNGCSGHGICSNSPNFICECDEGWGHSGDIADFKSADCSLRICPAGRRWFDIPTSATAAHVLKECSGNGICQRDLGECLCFTPWTGAACDRLKCPGTCSGHGVCMSMREYALQDDGLPLTNTPGSYSGLDDSTWDANLVFGCHCDSSWAVGLGNGETQVPEYYGPACELRRCPSGDDPMTPRIETDCENKNDNGLITACSDNNYYTNASCTSVGYWCDAVNTCYTGSSCSGGTLAGGREVSKAICEAAAGSWDNTEFGASGNLCHVECSNRGICDAASGTCKCFVGFIGNNCGIQSVYGFGATADG